VGHRSVLESHGNRARLELSGTGLVTAGLVAVVFPLVEGREHGWPAWTWCSLAAAPVLLDAFVCTSGCARRAAAYRSSICGPGPREAPRS